LRQQIKNKENDIKFIYEEISSLKRCVKHVTAEMQKLGYNTQEVENSYGAVSTQNIITFIKENSMYIVEDNYYCYVRLFDKYHLSSIN
jgi:hypothetical protein